MFLASQVYPPSRSFHAWTPWAPPWTSGAKKAAGVWVSGTSFLWSQLIFASVPCWNESWEANLFLVCCLLWAKTRCSKFFFEQIPNKILTTQIGSCSPKTWSGQKTSESLAPKSCNAPKVDPCSGHKIKAQGPPFGESPAWNWNQACRATKSSTSHPCFWAWHRWNDGTMEVDDPNYPASLF